ncbi:MAG: hypothetical protein R3B46_15045 [Phycisphaerales bacterium]
MFGFDQREDFASDVVVTGAVFVQEPRPFFGGEFGGIIEEVLDSAGAFVHVSPG